jgi:predicted DNA-binding transcriptional regulator YafY
LFHASRANDAPAGWGPLVAAAAAGRRVRMGYAGGTRGPSPREVTPRSFGNRGGVAFVVALCHLDGFEKSFRLDRVVWYEVLDESPALARG